MRKGSAYNPYAGLLPSHRAVAAAIWKLGLQPDWNTWTTILNEAAAIEERKARYGFDHSFAIDKVRRDT